MVLPNQVQVKWDTIPGEDVNNPDQSMPRHFYECLTNRAVLIRNISIGYISNTIDLSEKYAQNRSINKLTLQFELKNQLWIFMQ